MPLKKAKNAFTLIELLVVIAIIALLLSIVIPSLSMAKRKAAAIVCLANLNGLSKSWTLYADDNKGFITGGSTGAVGKPYYSWVDMPCDKNGAQLPGGHNNLEEEKIGIQRGTLFSYTASVDVYHCPMDKRFLKPPAATGYTGIGGWRTYSITGGMNGVGNPGVTPRQGGWDILPHISTSTIKSPGDKLVFLEEADGRGYNMGAWVIQPVEKGFDWIDPIAIWHGDSSTLGFADGHAERHKWVEQITLNQVNTQSGAASFRFTVPVDQRKDLEYMQRIYPYEKIYP